MRSIRVSNDFYYVFRRIFMAKNSDKTQPRDQRFRKLRVSLRAFDAYIHTGRIKACHLLSTVGAFFVGRKRKEAIVEFFSVRFILLSSIFPTVCEGTEISSRIVEERKIRVYTCSLHVKRTLNKQFKSLHKRVET